MIGIGNGLIGRVLSLRLVLLCALLVAASALGPFSGETARAETVRPDLRSGDRFTILLVGLDRRQPHEYSRSDVIMLLSIERKSRSLSLLSIPRDLWVTIPGYGWNRINASYFLGEYYESNGPELARQTVESVFDVPVHAVAAIDFTGFTALINSFGGVEVLVAKTLIDNLYPTFDYGYTRIVIPAGLQHMDGATALIYARTRHPDNDFKRMGRQQNIITSARAGLFSDEMIVIFPLLLQRFNEIVETDLTVAEQLILMRDLYLLNDVPIKARVIEPPFVYDYVTDGGAQVLLPNWGLVRPLIGEMFGDSVQSPVDSAAR